MLEETISAGAEGALRQTDRLKGARIGCALTGSFCTFSRTFEALRALKARGAELYPILSLNAAALDTRFFAAHETAEALREICGREAWTTLREVEPIGPKKALDLLLIAPCTGNSLGKLAHGIADTPVTLAAKSQLRNARPVLIAVSTNDGLGRSAENIGRLLAAKCVFFVPFAQDDPIGKPASTVACFERIPESAAFALQNRQIQPVLARI